MLTLEEIATIKKYYTEHNTATDVELARHFSREFGKEIEPSVIASLMADWAISN